MADAFDIVVHKYGGSSVASPEKIKAVAGYIKLALVPGKRICVVVSAMGKTTNKLLSLAQEVCKRPSKRELDMLVSCGERSSMALLAMALHDIGVKAVSLTGSQSGIITDENHSNAKIIAIKPERVLDAFHKNQVVIIAGFQGVSLEREITTLRRGGSDTTAVAMAAALKASACEIYTDVQGVMDIDPKLVVDAQVLPEIAFERMKSMSLYGARVLAHDALLHAKRYGVELRIANPGDNNGGTRIKASAPASSDQGVLAITHLRSVVRMSMSCDELPEAMANGAHLLCGAHKGSEFVFYVSNDIAQEMAGVLQVQPSKGLALITLHVTTNEEIFSALSQSRKILHNNDIALKDIVVGGDEIFLAINDEDLPNALILLRAGLQRYSSCNAKGSCR